MVDRQEVEALLADTEHKHRPMYVRNDTLAALCRAWLAVDGGLPGVVDSVLYADGGKRRETTIQHIDSEAFPTFRGPGRVRIVPVEGDERPTCDSPPAPHA